MSSLLEIFDGIVYWSLREPCVKSEDGEDERLDERGDTPPYVTGSVGVTSAMELSQIQSDGWERLHWLSVDY